MTDSEGRTVHSTLFQMWEGPTNDFAGGHGFTGLNYAYDAATGAEMQYSCSTV